MKAQSDLAGDRKRPAEMTGPRDRGVTTWSAELTDMFKRESELSTKYANALEQLGCEISFAPYIEAAASAFDLCEIPKTEVNNRPARQQCPVCTP